MGVAPRPQPGPVFLCSPSPSSSSSSSPCFRPCLPPPIPHHPSSDVQPKNLEVGSIIGKKGDIVKRFREESGAKINITDGSCPERIVTVIGSAKAIHKAFTLICEKFEEDLEATLTPNVPRPPITFRLVVPASQCGSLIGKGGSKIKGIREVTGASIQVASEMLPNSTERAVTVSGSSEAITQCIYNICNIMAESPPKDASITVPFRPHRTVYGAVPIGPAPLIPSYTTQLGKGGMVPTAGGLSHINGLAGFAPGVLNPAGGGGGRGANTHQTHEMTVPNEIIGCVIGKGGSKIAEIRQISGAMIRISNCEDRDAPANLDRTITISGNCESVALAQYLINMRISMETASLGGLAGFQYISPNHIIKSPQAH